MKLFTLQVKYSKLFENEVKKQFYKECLKILEEEYILNKVSHMVTNFAGLIDMLEITNDFIEFLYREWPLTSFNMIKNPIENYIIEKIGCEWDGDFTAPPDYTFYRDTRIQMEVLYRVFSKNKVYLKEYNSTDEAIINIEVKLNHSLREVSEIILDNKVYKFGIFYEKKEFKGLNFWKSNRSFLYERLCIDCCDYSYEDPYSLLDDEIPFISAMLCQDDNDIDYTIEIS